jgi:hypothetical protein
VIVTWGKYKEEPSRLWKTPEGATVDGPHVEEGLEDAAFFRDGPGPDLIATVSLGDKVVSVYCSGEMRVENLNTEERYVNAADLIAAGIKTDRDLTISERRRDIEFIHNPWFEVVVDGEDLDLIEHTYGSAILLAEGVLTNPDYDAMFSTEGVA